MRTKQEIDTEYTQKCMLLGDVIAKKQQLESQSQQLLNEIDVIHKEYEQLQKVEQELQQRTFAAQAATVPAVNNVPPENN